MNENIMKWSSNALYSGKLVAHEHVKDRDVSELIKEGDKVKASGSDLWG